jgi:hypothetical protein
MATFSANEMTVDDNIYEKEILNSNIKLKKHQLTSLQRCIELENDSILNNTEKYIEIKTNIGILSDRVGSGKSYVILSLILVNEFPKNSFNNINVLGNNTLYIEYNNKNFKKCLNLNIIVCSFGLIDQWKLYIKTMSDTFNYTIVNKHTNLNEFIDNFESYNLLLVSSTFYQHIVKFLNGNNYHVKRVIFDEADSSVTPNSKQIPANFYWFVTASYKNIINPFPKYKYHTNSMNINFQKILVSTGVNNNVFIKNLFGNLYKSMSPSDWLLIYNLIVKNSDSYINESFKLPEMQIQTIKCKNKVINVLNGITNKNIINSLNGGDLETAISYLNKNNTGNQDHIINIVKSDLDKSLRNIQLSIEYNKNIICDDEVLKQNKIKNLMVEEVSIKNKITMLIERIANWNMCSICYCEHDKKTVTICCNNTFCFKCICTWLNIKSSCPLCKKALSSMSESLFVIEDKKEELIVEDDMMDKFEMLKEMMKDMVNKNKKVLIFSEYDNTFSKIGTILKEVGIHYGMLKGRVLSNNLKAYKHGNLDVLMVNSQSFGSGLNLENTTDVILFHKFDSQIEKQVIGRAQRPGRCEPLKVWYLLYENEMK